MRDRSKTTGPTGLPQTAWAVAAIILLTLVAYLPAIRCGFIWDDDRYVTENVTLRNLAGLGQIWFKPGATVQYYPLSFTTFWIEYHLWGLDPAGYHVTNILLQGLNAVLLWLVLRRLAVPGAWLAAALFAVHPVQVESVAWITERKNVLCGAFYLATVLAYWRYVRLGESDSASPHRAGFCEAGCETGREAGRKADLPDRRHWYVTALVLFACALLSKSVACTLPAALLLVLWWKRDRLTWRDIRPMIPLLVMGLIMALTTAWVEKAHVGAVGHAWGLSWVERCLLAGRIAWFYLDKLIWPHPIIFVYPRWHIDAAVWWQYLYPAAALAALLALWLARGRLGKGPLIAALYFVGTLTPAMGFANVYYMQYSYVADHFQYLASIGPLAAIAALLSRMAGGTRQGPGRARDAGWRSPVAMRVVSAVVLAALVVLVWRCTPAYQNKESLWNDVIAKNPDAWMPHLNLANIYQKRGELDKAMAEYRKALQLQPDNTEVHYDLAQALFVQSRFEEAADHYRKAIDLDPTHHMAINNLGTIYLKEDKLDEAAACFEKTIRTRPKEAMGYYNLGRVCALRKQFDRAIECFNQALQLDPGSTYIRADLGGALIEAGHYAEGIQYLQAAMQALPDDAKVHLYLGIGLAREGKAREGIEHLVTAWRLAGDSTEFLNELAWAMATREVPRSPDWPDPVVLAEKACSLTNHQDPNALDTLAAVYANAGRFADAITIAGKAIEQARASKQTALADDIERRLKLYQAGRPYREIPTPAPTK